MNRNYFYTFWQKTKVTQLTLKSFTWDIFCFFFIEWLQQTNEYSQFHQIKKTHHV